MAKVNIREDCLAPSRWIWLEYSGPNPFGVASKIAESLQPFFQVSSAGVSETDFRWDDAGDPISFYFTWWVQRSEFSRWTLQRFDIKVQGEQTKESKEGRFVLQMFGTLYTEFSSSNPFTRGLFWIYDFLFYGRRRSEYLRECRDLLNDFRDEIKQHFNLAVLEKG